jgi:hypothetical protein
MCIRGFFSILGLAALPLVALLGDEIYNKNHYFKQGDIVSIESCDRYHWCKLQDNNGYIKKYQLNKITNNSYRGIKKEIFIYEKTSNSPKNKKIKDILSQSFLIDYRFGYLRKLDIEKFALLEKEKKILPKININTQTPNLQTNNELIKNNELFLFLSQLNDTNSTIKFNIITNENKKYFLNVETNGNGFVSVMKIVKNKKPEMLLSNKIAMKDDNFVVPNAKISDGLEILTDSNASNGTYFTAMICKEKSNFDSLNKIIYDDTKNGYILHELVQKLNHCKYTSKFIVLIKNSQSSIAKD